MQGFIQRHAANVSGVVSGFDRVRLRGTLRWLSNVRGMYGFLQASSVLLKDFMRYAKGITEQIRQRTVRDAAEAGRPLLYLNSSRESKEEIAREIGERDGVREGLICVLTCVEPCYYHRVGPNRERQRLELQYGSGKCLHQYHYFHHRELGFLHTRLQTWFPFTLHVCLNGRSWLARQMDAADLARRAKLCQAANERYLESLAQVDDATPLGQLTAQLCQPATDNGRRVRALNPFGTEDARLLAAVARGEFALQGFRNRDLRPLLFSPDEQSLDQLRKQSASVSRRLRLLRVHGLIAKIPKTHRYQLTNLGRTAISALLHAQHANAAQLNQLAA